MPITWFGSIARVQYKVWQIVNLNKKEKTTNGWSMEIDATRFTYGNQMSLNIESATKKERMGQVQIYERRRVVLVDGENRRDNI